MEETRNEKTAPPRASSISSVAMGGCQGAIPENTQSLERIQAEMQAVFRAAQERVAMRLCGAHGARFQQSRGRARQLLEGTRARARTLVQGRPTETPSNAIEPALSLYDLHTLERLSSYVRHSVVRVCFYNLKLFCPSLIDEYGVDVRDQVLANIDQLDAARLELERFFKQPLSNGEPVGRTFDDVQNATSKSIQELIVRAGAAKMRLDDESVRRDFALHAPALIDAIMDALDAIQQELDRRKRSVRDVAEQAAELSRTLAANAGLTVCVHAVPVPNVFADRQRLANAFMELVANAAKYSGGTRLDITIEPVRVRGQSIQIAFADDGRGMTPDELAACLERGASRGGTGEGLPMVIQIVEEEHLGEFEIAAAPGEGCRAVVRLPVKLDARKGTA